MSLEGQPGEGAPIDPAAEAEGTPEEQPQEAPAVAEATKSANALAGRKTPWDSRAYTQATQLASSVRRELGLSSSATEGDVLAAIGALRQQPTPMDYGDDLDPAVVQRMQQLEERVWASARATQGEEVVDAAQELWQSARATTDPYEFMQSFMAAVERVTFDPSAVDEATAEDEGTAEQMPDFAGGEGPPVPQPNADATGGRRGSGDLVGWLRSFRGET